MSRGAVGRFFRRLRRMDESEYTFGAAVRRLMARELILTEAVEVWSERCRKASGRRREEFRCRMEETMLPYPRSTERGLGSIGTACSRVFSPHDACNIPGPNRGAGIVTHQVTMHALRYITKRLWKKVIYHCCLSVCLLVERAYVVQ